VRPEGACHLWRKVPPGQLSIGLEADERIGWVTGLSLKGEGGIVARDIASGLRCSRGSYRQHATKGIDGNKGDPPGSSASL
jgi:hypothetical protein